MSPSVELSVQSVEDSPALGEGSGADGSAEDAAFLAAFPDEGVDDSTEIPPGQASPAMTATLRDDSVEAEAGEGGCLLYTSDAADDM
eukprot:11044772-Alexandrium_andersonii.AAC.1